MEKIPADHRVPEVQRLPEGLRLCGKRDVALVVVGVKAEGQLLKGGKVLLEAVGIFAQQAAVLLVSALQEFDVGLVKSLGHQLQQSFPLEAPAVEGAEGVIGPVSYTPLNPMRKRRTPSAARAVEWERCSNCCAMSE